MNKLFKTASDTQINTALLIMRVAVGAIFLAHGWQKVFTFGFSGVAGAFGQMGIPMPGVMGPFVAMVELLGGLALITGLLTRLAAAGLASTMVVAILAVHLPNGLLGPKGFELPLSLLSATIALVLAGAGKWSLDQAIVSRKRAPASAPVTTPSVAGATRVV